MRKRIIDNVTEIGGLNEPYFFSETFGDLSDPQAPVAM